ncbi:MAG: recombinase family protein [Roseovarius sp.]|nr:recombinase family protein [Roseovarius sp.]
MLVGYARVSTMDQNPALQMDALHAAGCEKIYAEKASGSHRDRQVENRWVEAGTHPKNVRFGNALMA